MSAASAVLRTIDAAPIPARAGIGLRAPHYAEVLDTRPAIAWLEVHSENFFADGGRPLEVLQRVRSDYPLSLHGVGLSLGSTDPLSRWHLDKLKGLIARYEPALVSEHLCWCSVGGRFFNDLLPLPYTTEALQHVSERIERVQDYLGRQILIENLSSYLQFTESAMPEWEFIAEVAGRSGCGILLDVNNIYVNACNHDFDPAVYLEAIPVSAVKEMHLAGFEDEGDCLIDTHGGPVAAAVWTLYARALQRFGRVPTLIEWDTDIPSLTTLLAEAAHAQRLMDQTHARVA
jgi:uncharacterized protein (UPF0276 family)